MGTTLNLVAILTGVVALVVSALSWHASVQANRASIFDQRFAVYEDVEKFISLWMRDGHPDLGHLPMLVRAWNRSHFLFESSVTAYIRKVWLDAGDADYHNKVANGDVQGDRQASIEIVHRLLREHADFDALRGQFLPQLKVAVRFDETLRSLFPWWK
jgi:hypothetical protein